MHPWSRFEAAQTPDHGGTDPLSVPQLLAYFRVPAVSIAVLRDTEIAWAKAWGQATPTTEATGKTLFQAASISKPVAAIASLRAVQDGRFGLDQDISTILRSWRLPDHPFAPGRPVTPRHLLSHTAGTGDGFGFPGYKPGGPLPTVQQILDGAPPANRGPVRLVRPPLTQFHYSGGGTTIQQLALTDTLGRPIAEILHEQVLAPAGMADSTYAQPLPPERHPNAAHAHDTMGQPMDAPWHIYPEQAAAGLWTTPTDLCRLAATVQRGLAGAEEILDRRLWQEMVTPVGVGPYGAGFMIAQRGQGWYFSHLGGNWGFACALIAHVAKGYGAAIMTNGANGAPLVQELTDRLARVEHWDMLDKPKLR